MRFTIVLILGLLAFAFTPNSAGSPDPLKISLYEKVLQKVTPEFSESKLDSIMNGDVTEGMRMKVYKFDDPQFEWSQFSDKKASALITEKGLFLISRLDQSIVCSVAELPIDPQNDNFCYGALFSNLHQGVKQSALIKDSKGIGLIFDYADNRNYKGISISGSQYCYFTVKDGVSSIVKTGLIKSKGQMCNLSMTCTGDKATVSLNNIEFAKLNKLKIENPVFGVFVEGKASVAVYSFGFNVEEKEDREVSTTDN